MGGVQEINNESIIQRVIRDNALAALMLVLAFITMVNGVIIGVGIAVILYQGEKYDALRAQFEVNSIYVNNLKAELAANDFKLKDTGDE